MSKGTGGSVKNSVTTIWSGEESGGGQQEVSRKCLMLSGQEIVIKAYS